MELLQACVSALETCDLEALRTAVTTLNASNSKNAASFSTNLGQSLIHLAIGYFIKLGAAEKLEELQGILRALSSAEVGCDVNKGDDKGMTASHYATEIPGATGVAILTTLQEDCKADIDVVDKAKDSVMHKACAAGNLEVVRYLHGIIQSGRVLVHLQLNKHNEKHLSPLAMAIEYGRMHVVRFLVVTCGVSTGPISMSERNTALHHASFYRQLDICKFLVEECKSDVQLTDNTGLTALHFAAMTGAPEVVSYLADQKADVTALAARKRNVLHIAAGAGHVNVVKLIIEDVIDASNDEGKQQPSAVSNSSSSPPEQKQHRFRAININSRDAKKQTALETALEQLHVNVAKYLLQMGAMIGEDSVRKLKRNAVAMDLLSKCYVCTNNAGKFLCTRCKHRRYCSVECQKIDYKGIGRPKHASICKLFA